MTRRRIVAALLVGGGILLTSPAWAKNPKHAEPCAEDCGPRTATATSATLIERNVAVPIPVNKLMEITSRQQVEGLEVEYKDEKQTIEVIELKPRTVEEKHTVYVTREFEEVDPCTGKCCKVCRPCPEERVVKTTVYDRVPVKKTVVVKVAHLKPVKRLVDVTTLCVEPVTVPGIATHFDVVINQEQVKVPCCPPPPPAPCVEAPQCIALPCDK